MVAPYQSNTITVPTSYLVFERPSSLWCLKIVLELVLKFEKVCIIVLAPTAFGSRQGRQAFATDQHNPTPFLR